jgi:hypothetical protein
MTKHWKPIRRSGVVALGVALTGATGRADDAPRSPIREKRLVEVTATKAQKQAWRTNLCARSELACAVDPDGVDFFRADDDPSDSVWVIRKAAPVLLECRHSQASGWRIEQQWDFSTYVHSRAPRGPTDRPPIHVFPTLYPVGPRTWAVALVSDVMEGYSGGGASYQVADFVPLLDTTATAAAVAPVYTGLRFSCSKMTRACFQGDEYRASAHCHEQWEGSLTLAYSLSSSPDRYSWTATWHEQHWPAHLPKAKTESTQASGRLSLTQSDMSGMFRGGSWCGDGPMAENAP